MAGSGFLGRLKQFDAYPKTLEDFKIKTYFGAASEGIVYRVCVSVWVWRRYVCVLGPWEGGGGSVIISIPLSWISSLLEYGESLYS